MYVLLSNSSISKHTQNYCCKRRLLEDFEIKDLDWAKYYTCTYIGNKLTKQDLSETGYVLASDNRWSVLFFMYL